MDTATQLFTAHMMPNGREYGGVWVIQKGKHTFYKRQYTHMGESLEKPVKEFFNRDESKGKCGWQKVTKTTKLSIIPAIQKNSINTYQDMFDLIQEHGALVAGLLCGFDSQNYGDQYCLRQINMLAALGQPMLDWMNKIAEVDAAIKTYWETKHGITFKKETTSDLLMSQGEGDSYNCSFRCSPFIGRKIQTSLMGILILSSPSIDVMSLDSSWKQLFRSFKSPEGALKKNMDLEAYSKHLNDVDDWYENGRSMQDNLNDMVGAELSLWVKENISPEFINAKFLQKYTKTPQEHSQLLVYGKEGIQ
ncbi:MAG: hypothetical protein P8J32_04825 [bacterium]|nr:hypothetical protein [bacterium]